MRAISTEEGFLGKTSRVLHCKQQAVNTSFGAVPQNGRN
jgi:hypothetical protein